MNSRTSFSANTGGHGAMSLKPSVIYACWSRWSYLSTTKRIAKPSASSRATSSFYDALMLAVALSGGARTIYSEDMQHGMTIDEALRVVDPFIPGALDA